MVVFWVLLLLAAVLLLYFLLISCTVRLYRPEYSLGAAWWPKDGYQCVVNAPGEQVGFDKEGKAVYPFWSYVNRKDDPNSKTAFVEQLKRTNTSGAKAQTEFYRYSEVGHAVKPVRS